MNKSKQLLLLKPVQMITHPRNMRRFYPADDVRELANSILASNGVLEPLIVLKQAKGDKWVVIDGNMRLAAARFLGDKCPALECKVVDQTFADQLLSMAIANQVRYAIDPVSEGLHYKALSKEGLTVRSISKRTGIYEARIINRMVLADLDEPIQKLITEKKLPGNAEVARAFLRLTTAVRIKVAQKLSLNPNVKISTILNVCQRLASDAHKPKKLKRPAVELSGALNRPAAPSSFQQIRTAAKAVCNSCNQYEGQLEKGSEPAWASIVHAADETCKGCSLNGMQKICGSCPAVELLRKIVSSNGATNAQHR